MASTSPHYDNDEAIYDAEEHYDQADAFPAEGAADVDRRRRRQRERRQGGTGCRPAARQSDQRDAMDKGAHDGNRRERQRDNGRHRVPHRYSLNHNT